MPRHASALVVWLAIVALLVPYACKCLCVCSKIASDATEVVCIADLSAEACARPETQPNMSEQALNSAQTYQLDATVC
jgi:hypothetical protein